MGLDIIKRINLNKVIGTCDSCGDPIYESDEHYEMPDGVMICTAHGPDCLEDWAENYMRPGVMEV